VFAADQRDGFSKTAAMHIDQHISMLLLDFGHIIKNLCRLRILSAQMIGVGAINTGIILFRRDGERQDFLFAKRREGAFGKGKKTTEHG